MSIPTVPAGTSVQVGVLNVNQDGDEILEVWLRPYIGVAGASGVPQEVSPGVWVGAGDFSEFALQGPGAAPAGLTPSTGQADHQIISSDTPAKRVWFRSEATLNNYTLIYDAFDDLFELGGEILGRVYVNTVAGSGLRHKWIIGVMARATAHLLGVQGHAFSNSFRWDGGEQVAGGVFAGLVTQINDGDPSGGFTPFWHWIRIRLDDAGGGNVRFRLHSTYSDFDVKPAVPGVWDRDETVAVTNLVGGVGSSLVFSRQVLGPRQASDRGWSFIGFTSDYTVQEAPGDVTEVSAAVPGAWYLAASIPVAAVADQVVTIDTPALDPGTLHDCALRYRRGVEFNAGAENTADPTTWPSISRGQFTTTIDPPTIVSQIWSRTSAIAEQIQLTVTPVVGSEALDINVYREKQGEGAPTLIGTIAGPHVGNAVFTDTTIDGEAAYFYSYSTVGLSVEGAQSAQQRTWSGPPLIPVFLYQNVTGGGYTIGYSLAVGLLAVQLEDTYDNLGGETAFALRATGSLLEIFSGNLVNVPIGGLTFIGRLRMVATLFAVDDFGEYSSPTFPITVPESE